MEEMKINTIYTLAGINERQLEEFINDLGDAVQDYDKSKVLCVQGYRFVTFSVVCSKTTLDMIVNFINGTVLL